MSKNLYFKKEVLLEGLKKALANISINIEKGCKNPESLQAYAKFYIAVSLKAYYDFDCINQKYTSLKMAIKKYDLLYINIFRDATLSANDLKEFLNPELYINNTEDEKFIILSMINLSTFITSNNINKTKQFINTYIPKIRSCLKNSNYYVEFFKSKNYSTLAIKTALFKFLVENG